MLSFCGFLVSLALVSKFTYLSTSNVTPTESAKAVDRSPSLRGARNGLPDIQPASIILSQAKGPAATLERYPYTDLFQPIFQDLNSRRKEAVSHRVRGSLSVAVGIMSEGPWADMRRIHRDSWMKSSCVSKDVSNGGVVPFFVMSGPVDGSLQHEMEEHADILLLPKHETPRNKTFAWFHQAVERIPGATFYAKMDADTFLDPCALLSDLASLRFTGPQALYYGSVMFKHDQFVCGVPATAARMPSFCGQASFSIEDSRPADGNWEGRTFPKAKEGGKLGHTAMHGAFYLISANIAQWMAGGGDDAVHLPMTTERTWGNGEDVIVADWVARFFQVHPRLQPRIKRRASDLNAVFRHVSEMLTEDQKKSVANQFPKSPTQVPYVSV